MHANDLIWAQSNCLLYRQVTEWSDTLSNERDGWLHWSHECHWTAPTKRQRTQRQRLV